MARLADGELAQPVSKPDSKQVPKAARKKECAKRGIKKASKQAILPFVRESSIFLAHDVKYFLALKPGKTANPAGFKASLGVEAVAEQVGASRAIEICIWPTVLTPIRSCMS